METPLRRLASTTGLILAVGFALACTGVDDPPQSYTMPPSGGIGNDTSDTGAWCGNAVVDEGEDCDPGAGGSDTDCGCTSDCLWVASGTSCEDGDLCTVGDVCNGTGDCLAEPIDCDDDDACTTDSCDGSNGTCVHGPWEGDTSELFDLDMLRDPDTLDLEFLDTDTVEVDGTYVEVAEIAFTSYESVDCEVGGIRVQAFVASTGSGPGLAMGSASGGSNDVAEWAVDYPVVALMWSSPGQGRSRGEPNTTAHMKDLDDDPRDSWFWEDAVLAMRALTVLEQWPGVDVNRLGVMGSSGSDVAAQLVAGVDDRVSLAVVSPSFVDLGNKQDRFEETLVVEASTPTLVLGSSTDLQGTASAFELCEDADGRLLIDSESALRFWIEGRWELDYGFVNVPDHPVLSGGTVDVGSHEGYTVVDTTIHGDWATVEYESTFGDTFELSSTP